MMSHLPSASVRGQDDMRPKTSALANRGVERARSGGAQVAMWFSVGSEDTGWVVRARGDYRDRTMENHRGRRRHGRVCTELGGACCPWLCPFLVRLRIPCSQLLVDVRHPPIVVVGPQPVGTSGTSLYQSGARFSPVAASPAPQQSACPSSRIPHVR